MTSDDMYRNRALPAFFSHEKIPAKVVRTADGRVTAFKLDVLTGGWEERPDLPDELFFGPSWLEVDSVDRDEFLTMVERERGRLHRTGPIFDRYARVKALEHVAESEDRWMTEEESQTVRALRRESYVLFETELRRKGDPGADPSLATEQDATAGQDAGGARVRAEISMTALSVQLKPILQALATDLTGSALGALRPRPEDYATAFVWELKQEARERYEELWDAGIGFRRPVGRTQIAIHLAPAGAFVDDNAMSRPFPGGYRSVVNLLTPTRVWAAWQYRSPGSSTGISYDGLVWCDDHWAFFPKPYRVLTAR